MEKMDLGSPDPFIIHLGTNDLRTAINLDFVQNSATGLRYFVLQQQVKWRLCCLLKARLVQNSATG
jgi:hypothetical protein